MIDLEIKLQDQAEITALWAQGVDVKFPPTGEYLPVYHKSEFSYSRRLFMMACRKCGEPVRRLWKCETTTCVDCKKDKQVEANKKARL